MLIKERSKIAQILGQHLFGSPESASFIEGSCNVFNVVASFGRFNFGQENVEIL